MTTPFAMPVRWDGTNDIDVINDVLVRAGVSCSRGMDQLQAFSPPMAGVLAFELNNISRDYSPGNGSSPYYGYLKPGKRVRFSSVALSSGGLELEDGSGSLEIESGDLLLLEDLPARDIFTGILDALKQRPEKENLSVQAQVLGMISRLVGKVISTPLYTNILISDALNYLLDEAGWPPDERNIQASTVVLPYWWLDGADAASALLQLADDEGPFAHVYEDGSGNIVFENNTYRLTQDRSTISQYTFDSSNSIISPFDYDDNYKSMIQACKITQVTRTPQALGVIWSYSQTLTLAANQAKTFTVRANDPFFNAHIPSPAPSDAVQLLTPSAPLTSGQFKFKFRGVTALAAVNWNDSDATLQASLESLSTIGAGNIILTGSLSTSLTAVFAGSLGGQQIDDLIEIVESTLNPISVPATIEASEVQPGGEDPPGSGIFKVEIQLLYPAGTLTAGTFTLFLQATGASGTTTSIAFNATAAAIQAAIRAVSGFGSTSCFSGPMNTAGVQVNFSYADPLPLMVVTATGLTMSVPSATINVTQSNKGGTPDYLVTAGSLADKYFDRTSGVSCTLTLVAGPAGATLTGLQVRAQLVPVTRSIDFQEPMGAAVPDGLIYKPDIWPVISEAQAQTFVTDTYTRRGGQLPIITLRTITDCRVAQDLDVALKREVSDRVTVVEPQIGIDEDFYVDRIRRIISWPVMVSEYGLEAVNTH
jgi:hypothetical protein